MKPSPLAARAALAFLAAFCLIPLVPGTTAQPAGVLYELFIDCPGARGRTQTCPIKAVDADDMMGSPSLAVDTLNPNKLILASLHGTDAQGPSERSRGRMPFTTFSSTDHGASWWDSPYTPPRQMAGAFGEHPQVTVDPWGHAYIGSLYSRRSGGTSENPIWEYVLVAQKFPNIDTIRREQSRSSGSYNGEFLEPIYDGNRIEQFWFVFNPRTDNMTMVWFESVPPPPKQNAAAPAKRAPALPSTILPAAAVKPAASSQEPGPKPVGAIGVVWSASAMKAPYYYQPSEYIIQPCRASTNPVLSFGYLYVGCIPDLKAGPFRWNNQTTNETVELFRMQPDGGEPEYMGSSPVKGGTPRLGVRSDGRLALLSAGSSAEGALDLVGAFGQYNETSQRIKWGPAINYNTKVNNVEPAITITQANIQDLIYREQSGVVHLILKERFEVTGVGVDAIKLALGPKIRKSIVAIDEKYGFLKKFPLDIGNIANRTDPGLLAAKEENYNDLSDDFLQLPMAPFTYNKKFLGDYYQREFFAVGDYGIIQFAELIEVTNLRVAFLPPAPPPPPPLPAAATALATTGVLVPVTGTALAGSIAASLFANRRKDPVAALAGRK